jgi:hypothetical protein
MALNGICCGIEASHIIHWDFARHLMGLYGISWHLMALNGILIA